jgi:2-amino-4-hydroxy-6-hydroxymethyldihydropteridine diphosphokinase
MSPSKSAGNGEIAHLALGSNEGDRFRALESALGGIAALDDTRVTAVSSVYETDPVGPVPQGSFLNAAVAIVTSLEPETLLAHCLGIETGMGRVRSVRWGPRIIDIDILAYGGRKMSLPNLELPHPRIAERPFVLAPLAEIAPSLSIGGTPVQVLAAAAGAAGVRRLDHPRLRIPG